MAKGDWGSTLGSTLGFTVLARSPGLGESWGERPTTLNYIALMELAKKKPKPHLGKELLTELSWFNVLVTIFPLFRFSPGL